MAAITTHQSLDSNPSDSSDCPSAPISRPTRLRAQNSKRRHHTRPPPTLTRTPSTSSIEMPFEHSTKTSQLVRRCSKTKKAKPPPSTLPRIFKVRTIPRIDTSLKPQAISSSPGSASSIEFKRDKPLPKCPSGDGFTLRPKKRASLSISRQNTLTDDETCLSSDPGLTSDFSSSSISLSSSEEKCPSTPPVETEVASEGMARFDGGDMNYFRHEHGMKHHPYSREEVPYMQAYDRVLLDNDQSTELLLNRLNPNKSPAFYNFSAPPQHVLDLGCGRGTWVVQAAIAWKSHGTKVTGFDIVDVKSEGQIPENVSWVKGNFITDPLPFDDNSFDFVRMANLTLAIPFNAWAAILKEARRVLAPGGRIEVIDDEMYFPREPPAFPPDAPKKRHSISSSCFDSDSGVTEGTVTALEDKLTPKEEWDMHLNNSENLEDMFKQMLEREYSVYYRPHEFIHQRLSEQFGKENSSKFRSYPLALARSQPDEAKEVETTTHGISWPVKRDKKRDQDTIRPPHRRNNSLPILDGTVPRKAAGLLGLPDTTEPKPFSAQSPGLVLFPSTFIPIPPDELEMHACKHMHVLLGCSTALGKYVRSFKSEGGEPFVDEKEFNDLLWEYQCFRRKRLNWPLTAWTRSKHSGPNPRPVSDMPEDASNTKSSLLFGVGKTKTDATTPTSPIQEEASFDKLSYVRTIRVWHAVKEEDDVTIRPPC